MHCRTLNLGILAHVDAGKTTLTERLLYAGGVIDEVGSVDDGSTQTDTLALERRRGITIRSAVVSFAIGDVTVNLIDTPGHPDFIAEVERVLGVLDGAVLVVSAVEGVQSQTRLLMRALQRLRVPTLLFVNKIDRRGADCDRVLQALAERLTPTVVPMGFASGLGTRDAGFRPYGAADPGFVARLVDALAENDDSIVAAFVDDQELPYRRLRAELATQTKRALVHPVFCGSASTGAGVEALASGIAELLPAATPDSGGPVSGTVFKVERGTAGEKVAYVRMFSGVVQARDRVQLPAGAEGKVTAVGVIDRGVSLRRAPVAAGEIAKVWGLAEIRVGDAIGSPRGPLERPQFAPPTLEAAVVPRDPSDREALHLALGLLAEQDPLIDVRQDDVAQELYVSLYGEVQKEVIQDTLAGDFGLEVSFRETTTICIERPAGSGEAVELLADDRNPFLATVGLRVEPAPPAAGVQLRLDVEIGSIPLYVYKSADEFRAALERTVRDALRQGPNGWAVTDCVVTLTRSGYAAPSTTAGDFRKLTPLVVMAALRRAGTVVCEPIDRFQLEIPADTLGPVLSALARLDAVPQAPAPTGSTYTVEGDLPAARTQQLRRRLPGLTRGEGVVECAFDRHEPVAGPAPTRPLPVHHPLNREGYLLRLARRG